MSLQEHGVVESPCIYINLYTECLILFNALEFHEIV